MAHLTDGDREVRKGARKIKKLEAQVAAERARLDDMKAVEALIERVAIAPLQASLDQAKARLAEVEAMKAASDDRMAQLKAQLAASKARAMGL